jgi:hypothetical protein
MQNKNKFICSKYFCNMSSTDSFSGRTFSKALDAFSKAMVDGLEPPKPNKKVPISPTLLASIHRNLCQSLKKRLPPAQIASIYNGLQEECRQSMVAWQQGISFWDPSLMQLEEIQKWIVSLPKGVIFASPACGNGLLEACIQATTGISVRCNDLQKQQRPFVADISQIDAIEFLNLAAEDERPIVIIASWLPGQRDANSGLSDRIFRWARDSGNNVVGVIHISDERDVSDRTLVACTDTVAALRFKHENFTTVVEVPRENPAPWESEYGLINDKMTIVIPNKE